MSTHLCSLRVLVVTLVLSFTCALIIPSNRYRKYDIASSKQRKLENLLVQLYQSLQPSANGENTFKEVLETVRPYIRPNIYALLRKNLKGRDKAKEIPQQRFQQKMATKQKKVSISQNELQSFFSEDRGNFWPYKPISLNIVKVQRFPDNFESFQTFDDFEIPYLNGKPSQRGGSYGSWDALPVQIPIFEEEPEGVKSRVQLDSIGETSREEPMDSFSLGEFVNDRGDCDTIKTQPCASEANCICNGFYTCRAGRCEPKSNAITGSGSPAITSQGIWHALSNQKRDRP